MMNDEHIARYTARLLQGIAVSIIVLTAVLGVAWNVNQPYDEAISIFSETASALRSGDISALVKPESYHRLIVSKILILPLYFAGIWNMKVQFFISFVLVLLMAWCIRRLIQASAIQSLWHKRALSAMSVIILFAFLIINHQHRSASIHLTLLCFLLAVLTLRHISLRSLYAACALCVVASFSFTTGILTWISLSPLFFHRYTQTRNLRYALLPLLLFVLCVSLYGYFAIEAQDLGKTHTVQLHPTTAISQFLLLSGSPFGFQSVAASFVIGTCLWLAISVAMLRHKADIVRAYHDENPWLYIHLFSVVSIAMVAVGRGGVDPQVLVQKEWYFGFAALSYCGLLVQLTQRLQQERYRALFLGGVLVLFFVLICSFLPLWYRDFVIHQKGVSCVNAQAEPTDHCLQLLYYSNPDLARSLRSEFALQGWHTTYAPPVDTRWQVDAIADDVHVDKVRPVHDAVVIKGVVLSTHCRSTYAIVATDRSAQYRLLSNAALLPYFHNPVSWFCQYTQRWHINLPQSLYDNGVILWKIDHSTPPPVARRIPLPR